MTSRLRRRVAVMLFVMVASWAQFGAISPATASEAPAYPREAYCNILDLTPECAQELEESVRRLIDSPLPDPNRAGAASCSVPEASMTNLGGNLPGHKRVQGYGYILCDRPVASMSIMGVLGAAQTQSEIYYEGVRIPVGYGDGGGGGWSCVNTYLCMMSTSVANGYGARVCFNLSNTGSTNEGYFGSKAGYDCF